MLRSFKKFVFPEKSTGTFQISPEVIAQLDDQALRKMLEVIDEVGLSLTGERLYLRPTGVKNGMRQFEMSGPWDMLLRAELLMKDKGMLTRNQK